MQQLSGKFQKHILKTHMGNRNWKKNPISIISTKDEHFSRKTKLAKSSQTTGFAVDVMLSCCNLTHYILGFNNKNKKDIK